MLLKAAKNHQKLVSFCHQVPVIFWAFEKKNNANQEGLTTAKPTNSTGLVWTVIGR